MSERPGVTTVTAAPETPETPDAPETPATRDAHGSPEAAPQPDAPTAPEKRSRRAGLRRWWARFLVLLMIVAAVLLGQRIIYGQAARDAAVDLGTVVLTAQAIPVETPVTGMVSSVDVVPGEHVTTGRRLGELTITTTDSSGDPVTRRQLITAPRDGIVVDNPVTVGSSLAPGQPFAELYDPAALRLVATVTPDELSQIAPGMHADLVAKGIDRHIEALVLRAVPGVESDDAKTPASRLRLVLAPADPAQIVDLIPGLRLTGSVDTRTGPKGSRGSVYVG